jgi:5-methylcytosine-specific restriction endonuclease McrA
VPELPAVSKYDAVFPVVDYLSHFPLPCQRMAADKTFRDITAFSDHLKRLHASRRKRVLDHKSSRPSRRALSKAARTEVLRKAEGRCHICGGPIEGQDWDADHVFAHSAGGEHSIANYLPAHSLCNNYRWHFDTQEFQWILKLGVWFRSQVERRTSVIMEAGARFVEHERRRHGRRSLGKGRSKLLRRRARQL